MYVCVNIYSLFILVFIGSMIDWLIAIYLIYNVLEEKDTWNSNEIRKTQPIIFNSIVYAILGWLAGLCLCGF